ncbi:MAG: hypothetical protein IPJ19_15650 [Planctomycetes bacterium]|nr:hypothetical protein [Planctomycetota bacterium]
MAAGLRRAPDPARAHGAWVYLFVSVLAGTLAARGQGSIAALCAGLAFVGVFVASSAIAVRPRPWRLRFASGALFAAACAASGLALGAEPMFLVYSMVALFPSAAAVWFAAQQGFLSPPALVFGVLGLTVAAPAAACAGGTSPQLGFLLLGLLAPFFAWRTWKTRAALGGGAGFDKARLRRLGLREAALAAAWMLACVGVVHLVAR